MACVVACAQALEGGEVNWPRAEKIYKAVHKEFGGDDLGDYPKAVLKTHWDHFREYGDLKDNPRSGRPPTISSDDAMLASNAIKAGREYTRQRKGHTIKLITYFTSVRQASLESDTVRGVMEKYNCTPHQLYSAMMRVDPHLGRRSFALKFRLSDAQKAARKTFAKELLAEWNVAQALLAAILARIVQCDEGRWTYSTYTHSTQKAYVDLSHLPLYDYVTLPTINGEKEATVHFFICVSAHPRFAEFNGMVYYEFTTGTTNIRRIWNTRGQTDDEAFVYQVSTVTELPACCQMDPAWVLLGGQQQHITFQCAACHSTHNWR
jgi:hypothetical protein